MMISRRAYNTATRSLTVCAFLSAFGYDRVPKGYQPEMLTVLVLMGMLSVWFLFTQAREERRDVPRALLTQTALQILVEAPSAVTAEEWAQIYRMIAKYSVLELRGGEADQASLHSLARTYWGLIGVPERFRFEADEDAHMLDAARYLALRFSTSSPRGKSGPNFRVKLAPKNEIILERPPHQKDSPFDYVERSYTELCLP